MEKEHCRQAKKVIQSEQVVTPGQTRVVFQGLNEDVAHGYQAGGDEITLVVEKVHQNGIQIPEDEKKGTILDQPPSPFHVKLLTLDGEDENGHGDQKKNMSQLVNQNTFFGAVHLGGVGHIRDQNTYHYHDH